MSSENNELAMQHLKKAELVSTESSGFIADPNLRMKLLAATYNNFGCLYRKRGKLKIALKYLRRALEIEESQQNGKKTGQAATYLNICVILSQLGKHERALVYATGALVQIQNEELSVESKKNKNLLAVTHHNIAVEHEFLQNYETAVENYRLASEASEKDFGANHPLTISIKTSKGKAEAKLKAKSLPNTPVLAKPSSASAQRKPQVPKLQKVHSQNDHQSSSRSKPKPQIVPQPPVNSQRSAQKVPAPARKYTPNKLVIPAEQAAVRIQKVFKGYIVRKKIRIYKAITQSYKLNGKNIPNQLYSPFTPIQHPSPNSTKNLEPILFEMKQTIATLSRLTATKVS
jgi:tetratricopeptide (TPR) repeat protein